VDDWQTATVSLDWLTEAASSETASGYDRAFEWLKAIGLVPIEISSVRLPGGLKVKSYPYDAIPVRYLAASACEWDSWGRSDPFSFVDNISVECAGTPEHESTVGYLSSLGHDEDEEAA